MRYISLSSHLFLFVLFICCWGSTPQEQPRGRAKIEIHVLTELNERVRADLELTNLSSPGGSIRASSDETLNLVPSLYLLRVAAPGFAKRVTVLRVDGHRRVIRVGVNIARLTDPHVTYHLKGTVETTNMKGLKGGWVRLVPLLNQQEVEETPISGDGSFLFEELAPGEYALLVLHNNRLIHARQVTCCSAGSVRVVIESGRKE